MKFYALADKAKPYEFYAKANTIEVLNERIDKMYWLSTSSTTKGTKFELADYLADKVIVLVNIEVQP